MIVKMSSAYATWRWNHIDSSRGSHRIRGLARVMRFRHIGSRIRVPSTVKTRPAALENHTDHFNALSASNLWFDACMYLNAYQSVSSGVKLYPDIPSCGEDANMCTPEQKVKQNLSSCKL
jgi:hypothetical protein